MGNSFSVVLGELSVLEILAVSSEYLHFQGPRPCHFANSRPGHMRAYALLRVVF